MLLLVLRPRLGLACKCWVVALILLVELLPFIQAQHGSPRGRRRRSGTAKDVMSALMRRLRGQVARIEAATGSTWLASTPNSNTDPEWLPTRTSSDRRPAIVQSPLLLLLLGYLFVIAMGIQRGGGRTLRGHSLLLRFTVKDRAAATDASGASRLMENRGPWWEGLTPGRDRY